MSLETAPFIHQLNPSNPAGADKLKEGDDHLRLIKSALKNTFPGFNGPLDASITPAFLLSLSSQLVPFGLMAPFYGAAGDVPAGWVLCHGQTVPKSSGVGNITVPDCRGRVIMGLPISEGIPGSTSGATSKTVSSAAAGEHTHAAASAPSGAHTHEVTGAVGSATTGASVLTTSRQIDGSGGTTALATVALTDPGHTHTLSGASAGSAGAHTHEIALGAVAGHGHQVTVDVTQPTVAYHIIIKI